MARVKFIFLVCLLCAWVSAAFAGTYTYTDGQSVNGDPVAYNKNGVILKSGGKFSDTIPWSKFSQESLKQLSAEAKKPADRAHIEPYLEEVVMEQQKRKEINWTPPPRVDLPTGTKGFFAMFTSPLGLLLLVLIYAANIYAANEIALFRYRPRGVVCGVAAVAPIIGPAIFLAMPAPKTGPQEQVEEAPVAEHQPSAEEVAAAQAQAEAEASAAAAAAEQAAAPALPQVISYKRGQVIFNRRFIETKFAPFLKTVPSEADQDLLVYVNSARGEFVGKRISKLTQTELHLLTFSGEATAEEVIPFNEISEIQIRHKDLV